MHRENNSESATIYAERGPKEVLQYFGISWERIYYAYILKVLAIQIKDVKVIP